MSSSSAIIAALLIARVISGIQGRLSHLVGAAVLAIKVPIASPPIVSVSISVAIIPVSIPIVAIIPIVSVVIRILGIVSALERQLKISAVQVAIA